jgi:RNA polymerase sigma factor (sigma-70 family)
MSATPTLTARSLRDVMTAGDATPPRALVASALAGDRRAWEEIVARYKGVAWKVIATFDLSQEDRNDIFAATFFRLFDRLATIREPEKLPGWLATTARNEALTLLRARRRERPAEWVGEEADDRAPHDEHLLDEELRDALRQAMGDLDPDCRRLLLLLTAEPPLSYDDIAALTGRPRGSIGPTRQRCLERLRRSPHLRAFLEERS